MAETTSIPGIVEQFITRYVIDDEKVKGALRAIYLAGYMDGCNDAKTSIQAGKYTMEAPVRSWTVQDLVRGIDGLVVTKKPEFDEVFSQLVEEK